MRGQIKTLNSDRGFGFIRTTQGDMFFHRSGMAHGVNFDTLQVGENVQFDEEDSQKGPRAVNVDRV